MKLVKRSGNLEDFDIGKVKMSVGRVSDELREPLTDSDLSFIAAQVEKGIFEKHQSQVSHRDVHFLVVDILNLVGFSKIAARYDESSLSRVREG
jgi:transcriptional regulator NrdR family protein